MRHLTAIFAVLMLLSVTSESVSAGSKIELMDHEMDEVSAAAGSFFDVIFLTNPSIKQIGFTSNASGNELKINGVVTPVESKPLASNGSFQAVALVTKTTSLGSQPGLPKLGLIQTSSSSFLGFNPSKLPVPVPIEGGLGAPAGGGGLGAPAVKIGRQ